jgi:hypothetical protein
VVSDRELEDRPYQPLRATGHGDADGLMSANGGPGSRSWLIRGLPSLEASARTKCFELPSFDQGSHENLP